MMEDEQEQFLDSRDLQLKALRSGSTSLRFDALKKIQHEIESFCESLLKSQVLG
jgi:hypothetical protein